MGWGDLLQKLERENSKLAHRARAALAEFAQHSGLAPIMATQQPRPKGTRFEHVENFGNRPLVSRHPLLATMYRENLLRFLLEA
jgi:hypothetical protein